MNKVQYPNILKVIKPPENNFIGVRITGPESFDPTNGTVIQGVFVIPKKNKNYNGQSYHRSLTGVLWSKAVFTSFRIFKEIILFPDDIETGNFGQRGYFNFEIMENSFPLYKGLSYYLHVSSGFYLSNSIKIIAK